MLVRTLRLHGRPCDAFGQQPQLPPCANSSRQHSYPGHAI